MIILEGHFIGTLCIYSLVRLFTSLSSIGQKDHLHSAGVHFHNLGLWGSDVTNGSRHSTWKVRKLSSIRSLLGHEKVSMCYSCYSVFKYIIENDSMLIRIR